MSLCLLYFVYFSAVKNNIRLDPTKILLMYSNDLTITLVSTNFFFFIIYNQLFTTTPTVFTINEAYLTGTKVNYSKVFKPYKLVPSKVNLCDEIYFLTEHIYQALINHKYQTHY